MDYPITVNNLIEANCPMSQLIIYDIFDTTPINLLVAGYVFNQGIQQVFNPRQELLLAVIEKIINISDIFPH